MGSSLAPHTYPRPAILGEIDLDRHAVIEASAGTGKTYTLEHLVVELVLTREVPLEQILVVTFTEKATREMRERVRAKLRDLLEPPDEAAPAAAEDWVIDEVARRRLGDALAVFDRAPISTIHAFCQRVLTESAFDCARLLRQEQVESREVFAEAFRQELRVALAPGARLAPVLERALSQWDVQRLEDSLYRWYVERGAPEPRFDRARAEDALKRLPTRLELGPSGFARRALESGLSRNPKKEIPPRLLALAPTVEALRAGGDFFTALLSFWDWAQQDAPGKRTNLQYVRHYLGKAKAPLTGLADLVETLGRSAGSPLTVLLGEMLPQIAMRLSGRKSERGHFDFDDMLRMLRDALFSDGGEVLADELRRRYRVALVDEFQDTDRVQWDIFRRVFFEAPATGSETDRRLILIGDPKQAIYGFRNADVHTYHAARDTVVEGGGQSVPLTVSFRSSAPLIAQVNAILAEGFFTGVNAYPHPVSCGRPERRALAPDGSDAPPVTLLHLVGRPQLRRAWVERALGAYVAAEIRRLLEGGLRLDDGEETRPLAPSDVHVLCRSKRDAEAVGRALAEASVPHAHFKQEGLFQTEAARHVWELLRAVESPDDPVRRLHAWLTPFFAVPLDRLGDCRDLPPQHPLVSHLSRWRELAESQRWAALFRALVEESGLARRELFAAQSERRLTDYQHILEVLLEETHRGRRSISQLLARLGAFIEERELPPGESGNVHRLESERNAVQILTMHKSKGLEAEVVFLVGGLSEVRADGLAPKVFHDDDGRRVAWIGDPTEPVRARIERERREEAERLLYVALTRARRRLYLPYFGPPPPGVEVAGEASFELEAELPLGEPAGRPQLDLFFDDPQEAIPQATPADEGEYELRRLDGPYRVLNERLRALVESGHAFDRAQIDVTPSRDGGADPRLALDAWAPPAALLGADPDEAGRFARLRRARGGFDVTSYTRMKRLAGGFRPAETDGGADGAAEESFVAESVDAALPEEETMPGGAAVGVFLHEVLEHLDFAAVEPIESAEAMLLDPDIRARFEARAAANGVETRWMSHAAALVHAALHAPLRLADGGTLPGLCRVGRLAKELPFLHPIPERGHPRLGEGAPRLEAAGLRIDRGFVRGVIDLIVEHEGRYHVLDYKSDRLPSYAEDAVAGHVENNYLVQARLYTLGALKALSIHDEAAYEARFGGLLYLFLRGLEPGTDATWSLRPTWREVCAWEGALLEDAPWGYPLPARRVAAP